MSASDVSEVPDTPEVSAVAEARFVQGDLVRAAQLIIRYHLPLTSAGAEECERMIRENGEGNRDMWVHPTYLQTTVYMAQAIIAEFEEGLT
jgi:hypothetical protein